MERENCFVLPLTLPLSRKGRGENTTKEAAPFRVNLHFVVTSVEPG